MRHHEQLSNSEVAQALGLSPAAAGMRHLRALRRLRESWRNGLQRRMKARRAQSPRTAVRGLDHPRNHALIS